MPLEQDAAIEAAVATGGRLHLVRARTNRRKSPSARGNRRRPGRVCCEARGACGVGSPLGRGALRNIIDSHPFAFPAPPAPDGLPWWGAPSRCIHVPAFPAAVSQRSVARSARRPRSMHGAAGPTSPAKPRWSSTFRHARGSSLGGDPGELRRGVAVAVQGHDSQARRMGAAALPVPSRRRATPPPVIESGWSLIAVVLTLTLKRSREEKPRIAGDVKAGPSCRRRISRSRRALPVLGDPVDRWPSSTSWFGRRLPPPRDSCVSTTALPYRSACLLQRPCDGCGLRPLSCHASTTSTNTSAHPPE